MTVSDIGEFGLISRIVAHFPQSANSLLGPGDDAAIIRAPDGRVVASTDLLIEGRHFRLDWSTAEDIGHKAAAQSLADIVAMGANPTALIVGLACPADTEVSWTEEFAQGMAAECELVGASVVGGDVSRADSVLISVTALGDMSGRSPVTRSGAQVGDRVAVAGQLGGSAAGHAVLSRGFRSPRALVESHQRPHPPYGCGPAAATLGATSMCDVSDGLVADLGHIAEASGVCLEITGSPLTVTGPMADAATALGLDARHWILAGGEDHALAATFPPDIDLPEPWLVIGRVTRGRGVLVDGETYPDGGFDHFK